MANSTISELDELIAPNGGDWIPIVDTSAGQTKKLDYARIANTNNFINVKSYGAVGDNLADDTFAIQASINAAQNIGGTIYFEAGTYLVSSDLIITGRNLVIFLDAGATLIAASNGSWSHGLIQINGNTNRLSNVTVYGHGTIDINNESIAGIFAHGDIVNVNVYDIEIHNGNANGRGIWYSGQSPSKPARSCIISRVYIHDVLEGIVIVNGMRILLSACVVENMDPTGQDNLEFSDCIDCAIVDCIVRNPGGANNAGVDIFSNTITTRNIIISNTIITKDNDTINSNAVSIGSTSDNQGPTNILVNNVVIRGEVSLEGNTTPNSFNTGYLISANNADVAINGGSIRGICHNSFSSAVVYRGNSLTVNDVTIENIGWRRSHGRR